jgi:Fe-S cluster assembly iron-binding protein IscA
MLTITQNAALAIRGLVEAPGAEGVRISSASQPSNGSGPGLQVEVSPAPEPHDDVVDAEGARLFLAPGAADALDGKVLDADVEGDEVRFAVLDQQVDDHP